MEPWFPPGAILFPAIFAASARILDSVSQNDPIVPPPAQPLPEDAEKVFSGVLFDVYQWEQELFDGSTATFEKVVRPDTAVLVPSTEDGEFLVVEDRQPAKETFRGFPAGRIEPGEDPAAAAKRELREETGFEPKTLELWKAFRSSSKIESVIYVYVARGCRKVGDPNPDPGERISVSLVGFDEFVRKTVDGEFSESVLDRDVLRAALSKDVMERLRRTWLG